MGWRDKKDAPSTSSEDVSNDTTDDGAKYTEPTESEPKTVEPTRDPGTGSVNDPAKQPITGATTRTQTSSVAPGSEQQASYHTGGPDQQGQFNDDAGTGPTVGTPNAPSSDGPDDGELRPEQEGGTQPEPATTSEPNPDYVASGESDADKTGQAAAEPASDEDADKIEEANSGKTNTTPEDGKNDDSAATKAATGGK